MTWRSNRRTFLMGMAAAASAAAAPSTLRTAFIGVGNRGGTLLGQTLEQEGVNITAICDIDPAKRDEALSRAAKFNPKSYTDWREVVALDNVDAIKIATPCYLHAEMAAAALKAGKYVYCEKPLGITPEQVASVLKASQGAKGFLQIGQQLRYFPTVRETMKAIHEDQVVGKIFAVRAQRDSTPPKPGQERPRPAWYEDPKKSGDLIVENAVHNIDCCNWIIGGHPVSAYGHGARYLPNLIPPGKLMMDGFSVQYIYDEQTHLEYTQLYLHPRNFKEIPNGQYYAIQGEKGTVFFTHDDAVFYDMYGDSEPKQLVSQKAKDTPEFAMSDFYACIREGRKPFGDIKVGATAALTAIMGREAIYKGASVTWNELGVKV
ncbi:MAG: Gfo/Idh/MocA family oxidoreductase [Bryobacterales bacterium]|nr:Gfo/Idh/MocA family oxidoreductase [Acidobacteriota bacterium]MCB9384600.1 Gfo/Idh/MocA family oxidoreductase [Bryobacterales bacterium]